MSAHSGSADRRKGLFHTSSSEADHAVALRYEVEVIALREQRGSAALAQQCYRETEASRAAREAAAEQRRLEKSGYQKPATKPDKRARRLIRALGDIDAF